MSICSGALDLKSASPVASPESPVCLRATTLATAATSGIIELRRPAAAPLFRHARLLMVAVAVSLLIHTGVAVALIWMPDITMEGGGGDSEGAGIELVSGAAIESMASAPATEIAASRQLMANAGDEVKEVRPAIAATDTAPPEKAETPALTPNAAEAQLAATPDPKPEIQPEETAPKTDEGKGKDVSRNSPQDASVSGGATARGASESAVATEAAAAASEGEMSRYASELHRALIRQRPHHAGSGRVKIEFGLTSAGLVREVRVVKSSGDEVLDMLAVRSLHKARFPAPPVRATEAQLHYVATIKFE